MRPPRDKDASKHITRRHYRMNRTQRQATRFTKLGISRQQFIAEIKVHADHMKPVDLTKLAYLTHQVNEGATAEVTIVPPHQRDRKKLRLGTARLEEDDDEEVGCKLLQLQDQPGVSIPDMTQTPTKTEREFRDKLYRALKDVDYRVGTERRRSIDHSTPSRVMDAHVVILADSQGGSFTPNGFLAPGTVMITLPGITLEEATRVALQGKGLFPNAKRIVVWAATNEVLRCFGKKDDWIVEEGLNNTWRETEMSRRVQYAAAKVVKVLQETRPPPDVHLVIATSPMMTSRMSVCNVVGFFIHQLHDLIIDQFGLHYSSEVFETHHGVTVLMPKRRAGHVEMGSEVHILPHQALMCLADIEFLLRFFIENQRKKHTSEGAHPVRILKSVNSAISTAQLCQQAASQHWKAVPAQPAHTWYERAEHAYRTVLNDERKWFRTMLQPRPNETVQEHVLPYLNKTMTKVNMDHVTSYEQKVQRLQAMRRLAVYHDRWEGILGHDARPIEGGLQVHDHVAHAKGIAASTNQDTRFIRDFIAFLSDIWEDKSVTTSEYMAMLKEPAKKNVNITCHHGTKTMECFFFGNKRWERDCMVTYEGEQPQVDMSRRPTSPNVPGAMLAEVSLREWMALIAYVGYEHFARGLLHIANEMNRTDGSQFGLEDGDLLLLRGYMTETTRTMFFGKDPVSKNGWTEFRWRVKATLLDLRMRLGRPITLADAMVRFGVDAEAMRQLLSPSDHHAWFGAWHQEPWEMPKRYMTQMRCCFSPVLVIKQRGFKLIEMGEWFHDFEVLPTREIVITREGLDSNMEPMMLTHMLQGMLTRSTGRSYEGLLKESFDELRSRVMEAQQARREETERAIAKKLKQEAADRAKEQEDAYKRQIKDLMLQYGEEDRLENERRVQEDVRAGRTVQPYGPGQVVAVTREQVHARHPGLRDESLRQKTKSTRKRVREMEYKTRAIAVLGEPPVRVDEDGFIPVPAVESAVWLTSQVREPSEDEYPEEVRTLVQMARTITDSVASRPARTVTRSNVGGKRSLKIVTFSEEVQVLNRIQASFRSLGDEDEDDFVHPNVRVKSLVVAPKIGVTDPRVEMVRNTSPMSSPKRKRPRPSEEEEMEIPWIQEPDTEDSREARRITGEMIRGTVVQGDARDWMDEAEASQTTHARLNQASAYGEEAMEVSNSILLPSSNAPIFRGQRVIVREAERLTEVVSTPPRAHNQFVMVRVASSRTPSPRASSGASSWGDEASVSMSREILPEVHEVEERSFPLISEQARLDFLKRKSGYPSIAWPKALEDGSMPDYLPAYLLGVELAELLKDAEALRAYKAELVRSRIDIARSWGHLKNPMPVICVRCGTDVSDRLRSAEWAQSSIDNLLCTGCTSKEGIAQVFAEIPRTLRPAYRSLCAPDKLDLWNAMALAQSRVHPAAFQLMMDKRRIAALKLESWDIRIGEKFRKTWSEEVGVPLDQMEKHLNVAARVIWTCGDAETLRNFKMPSHARPLPFSPDANELMRKRCSELNDVAGHDEITEKLDLQALIEGAEPTSALMSNDEYDEWSERNARIFQRESIPGLCSRDENTDGLEMWTETPTGASADTVALRWSEAQTDPCMCEVEEVISSLARTFGHQEGTCIVVWDLASQVQAAGGLKDLMFSRRQLIWDLSADPIVWHYYHRRIGGSATCADVGFEELNPDQLITSFPAVNLSLEEVYGVIVEDAQARKTKSSKLSWEARMILHLFDIVSTFRKDHEAMLGVMHRLYTAWDGYHAIQARGFRGDYPIMSVDELKKKQEMIAIKKLRSWSRCTHSSYR